MYHNAAGLGAAVVTLPQGKYLSSVSAVALAAGGTIQITHAGVAGPLVPVPNPGSTSLDVQRGIVGGPPALPTTIAFVGTSQYLVEWFDTILTDALGGP